MISHMKGFIPLKELINVFWFWYVHVKINMAHVFCSVWCLVSRDVHVWFPLGWERNGCHRLHQRHHELSTLYVQHGAQDGLCSGWGGIHCSVVHEICQGRSFIHNWWVNLTLELTNFFFHILIIYGNKKKIE